MRQGPCVAQNHVLLLRRGGSRRNSCLSLDSRCLLCPHFDQVSLSVFSSRYHNGPCSHNQPIHRHIQYPVLLQSQWCYQTQGNVCRSSCRLSFLQLYNNCCLQGPAAGTCFSFAAPYQGHLLLFPALLLHSQCPHQRSCSCVL